MATPEFPKHPFLLSAQEVEQSLETNVDNGLSSAQVPQLQQKYGPNELEIGGAIAWYTILIRQLANAMVLVRFNPQLLTRYRLAKG